MTDKVKIYFAAPLFNGRGKLFNSELSKKLENKGHEVFLPQRDGFEFSRLGKALYRYLSGEKIDCAVQDIIYLYDMGWQLPGTDMVLANFDDVISEGVVTEVCYAHLMGKPVIGFRTDVRSPYGSGDGRFGGMHFFPAYQTDVFLRVPFSARTKEELDKRLSILEIAIDGELSELTYSSPQQFFDFVTKNPGFLKIFERGKTLFEGISDVNSIAGLEEIAYRYTMERENLEEITPRVLKG